MQKDFEYYLEQARLINEVDVNLYVSEVFVIVKDPKTNKDINVKIDPKTTVIQIAQMLNKQYKIGGGLADPGIANMQVGNIAKNNKIELMLDGDMLKVKA